MGIRERLLAEPGGEWRDRELGDFICGWLKHQDGLKKITGETPSKWAAGIPNIEELYARWQIEKE